MLEQYDFLVEEGFKGIAAVPHTSQIEEMIDLWMDLEGEIPPNRNMVHELFKQHRGEWKRHLKTNSPYWSSVCRAWWLENARIRYNFPEKYNLRHIRRDWYGKAEDPHVYAGKGFLLPVRGWLGMKPQPAEEDYDRFHKNLKEMVFDNVFGYDILQLSPKRGFGVRDVKPRRAKACAGVFIGTEKMIEVEQLREFCNVYGVSVRTSVAQKASSLSNYAVIQEFVKEYRKKGIPILLVTIADLDWEGITGVHLPYRDHFRYFYPEVEHVIGGVYPEQVPEERLVPGDALYADISPDYWLSDIEEGKIPESLAPYEYEGKYYGIEMDAVGMAAILPTIVEKLGELGCGQRKWTEWAREQTQPDPDAVETNVAGQKARSLEEHNVLASMKSKVREEKRRKTDAYWDKIHELRDLLDDVEDLVEEKIEGEGQDIMDRPDFDDRRAPPHSTLISRVAEEPIEPYETYWDPETKTGFSQDYLRNKLRDKLEELTEKRQEDIKEQVSDQVAERIQDLLDQTRKLLDEVHTRSRVR